jgi:hypothetical protein
LSSTLLAAWRFSNAKWKAKSVSHVKKLLEQAHDPYLNAWLAYRESSISRMSGMVEKSENVMHGVLHHLSRSSQDDPELSSRSKTQRGDLFVSFAENRIRQGMLNEAKAELVEWRALGNSTSTLEVFTSRARDIIMGTVLRIQGQYEEAIILLQGVLQDSLLDDPSEGTGWYRVLLSQVADLYCELGQPASVE